MASLQRHIHHAPSVSKQCCLTRRSTGPATAGGVSLARSGFATVARQAYTARLRGPVSSNVRHRMTRLFSGSGSGIQTPDGCSVEFYRRLPYMGELSEIEAELCKHAAALELGCGTGRLCERMRELGLHVTGVDESAEMLAHLPSRVTGIKGSIEALDLGRRWPAVLLPSHLINHPDELTRRRFVEAAMRHIEPTGVFYVKRHSTTWLEAVQQGLIGESNGVTYHADHVSRDGRSLTMTLRYEAFGQSWTQSFTTCALDKHQIEEVLRSCGFRRFNWFGEKALWVAATPSDA